MRKKTVEKIQMILLIGAVIKVLGLVYKIVLTRILGMEGMRLMSLVFPTLSLALCLSSLCIPAVVNQNIAANLFTHHTRASTIVKAALRITFISSSLISLILMASFPLYKVIFETSFIYYPLLMSVPLIYISNCTGVLRGYLEAKNRFDTTYLANLFEQITKIALCFFLLFLFKDSDIKTQVLLCFLSMTVSEFASFFYIVAKIKKTTRLRYTDVSSLGYEKKILKQALPLTFNQLVITLDNYLEPFLFYLVATKVGISIYDATVYYTEVTSFAIPLLIFAHFGVQSISKFTFPKITELRWQKELLHPVLRQAFFFCFLIAVFNFMLCYFYAEESLLILFKDASSSTVVSSLAVLYFFAYFNPLFVAILQAYNKEKRLLITTIVSSFCSLLGIIIWTLIPTIALEGFVLGLAGGSFVRFLRLFYFAHREVRFKVRKLPLLCLILFCTCYFLANLIYHHLLYFLLVTLIAFLLALLLYRQFYRNNKSNPDRTMRKESL